jgi:hypothetical protein
MKSTYLPSSNPDETRGQSKRKSKLRAIDAGTHRDITGGLRRLTREIERGEHGDVRDLSVILSRPRAHGDREILGFHWGAGTRADVHWMLTTAKNRVEPA